MQYGHLVTKSMGVQIWSETEPHGLILRPDPSSTWIPHSLGTNDTPLMEVATTVYNPKGSAMINPCRLYLHVISLYDILTYDLQGIHPSYKQGERPPVRHLTIHWPNYPKNQKLLEALVPFPSYSFAELYL